MAKSSKQCSPSWKIWRGAAGRRAEELRIWSSSRAASSMPGISRSAKAAGEPLQGVAGSVASLFPVAESIERIVVLIRRLYGIGVRERPDVSVWHPSVRYYDLLDRATIRWWRVSIRSYSRGETQRCVDGRMRCREILPPGGVASPLVPSFTARWARCPRS